MGATHRGQRGSEGVRVRSLMEVRRDRLTLPQETPPGGNAAYIRRETWAFPYF